MSNTLDALTSLGNVGEYNRNQKLKEQQIAQTDLLLAKQQQDANDQNMLRAELQSPLGGLAPGVPASPEGLNPVPPNQLPNPDRVALDYWSRRDPKIAVDIYKNIGEKAKDIAERTGDPKQAVDYFNDATGMNAEFKGMKGSLIQVQVDGQTHLIEYNPVGGDLKTKAVLGERAADKLITVGEKSRLYDPRLGKVVVEGVPDNENVPVKSEHNIKGPDGKPKTLLIYKNGRREYLDSVPSPSAVINAGVMATQRQFQNENQLRTQFLNLPEVKERPIIEQQIARSQSAIDEAKKGGPKVAVDQTLIISFNKMLDANSVVRESEYARTSQDLALVNRIRGGYEKILEGGAGLTNEDRSALYYMIDRFGDASKAAYEAQVNQYNELADYWFPGQNAGPRVTRLGMVKAPTVKAPSAPKVGPKIGTVEKDAQGRDRIFTGGDPGKEENWRLK